MAFDDIAKRMKDFYESRTQTCLPRRTYTVVRIDGRAFHTYTRGLDRPFDTGFIADMNDAAKALCQNIQGAVLGYIQSDEISIIMSDFGTFQTDAWFDGNVQKIVSIAASIATAEFNHARILRKLNTIGLGPHNVGLMKMAQFDARAFTIPDAQEVQNYLYWRQQDATRNSISSVAQSLFSSKELHGKNTSAMQEMIFQKSGQNWNDFPVGQKRGRAIMKRTSTEIVNVPVNWEDNTNDEWKDEERTVSRWTVEDPPVFSQDREYLGKVFKDLQDNMQR